MSDFDIDDDDDFDELFNYDIDKINTTFDTNKTADDEQAATASKAKGNAGGEDLGVDEEIKIRTRKPKVKLTEERLLGPDGIPYLQEHAAKKIKFKGKGHEISDLERLLKFYQIWADNLFPKAQFKDVIEMIEKLGSSRGMQRKREEWIEEFKTKRANEDDRLIRKAREVLEADAPKIDGKGRIVLRIADPLNKPEGPGPGERPREGPDVQIGVPESNRIETVRKDNDDSLFFDDDDDDDLDELDEILKQAEISRPAGTARLESRDHDEMDELDAIMRDMETDTGTNTNPEASSRKRNIVESDDEFEDAMAAMREIEG
ncbi:chromosome segregation in meiosis- protein [Arthrobotrys megalospora]